MVTPCLVCVWSHLGVCVWSHLGVPTWSHLGVCACGVTPSSSRLRRLMSLSLGWVEQQPLLVSWSAKGWCRAVSWSAQVTGWSHCGVIHRAGCARVSASVGTGTGTATGSSSCARQHSHYSLCCGVVAVWSAVLCGNRAPLTAHMCSFQAQLVGSVDGRTRCNCGYSPHQKCCVETGPIAVAVAMFCFRAVLLNSTSGKTRCNCWLGAHSNSGAQPLVNDSKGLLSAS
jgi:hypothetical protein